MLSEDISFSRTKVAVNGKAEVQWAYIGLPNFACSSHNFTILTSSHIHCMPSNPAFHVATRVTALVANASTRRSVKKLLNQKTEEKMETFSLHLVWRCTRERGDFSGHSEILWTWCCGRILNWKTKLFQRTEGLKWNCNILDDIMIWDGISNHIIPK